MLSINDVKEIRELYRGFFIEEVTTTYNTAASVGTKKKVTELVITNYKARGEGLKVKQSLIRSN